MQPLKTVKGRLIHTSILDKYNNVKVDPFPFCVQGKEKFFKIICTPTDLRFNIDQNLVLKSIEHSNEPAEFNAEISFLFEGHKANEKLANPLNIVKILSIRLGKEAGTGRIFSETLFEDCGKNLIDYIEENDVSEKDLSEYGHGVADALYYIHTKGFFHGDLRPEKIFIDNKKIVKLLDFGGAMFLTAGKCKETNKLLMNWNTIYLPPEKFEVLDLEYIHAKDSLGLHGSIFS